MKRIPRPTGLTLALKQKQKKESVRILIRALLERSLYHRTQGQLIPMTMTDLAKLIGVSETKIMKLANDYYQGLGINLDMESYSRAFTMGLLNGALQDRYRAEAWMLELQGVARKKGYHALQLKEANSAMGIAVQTNQMLLKLAQELRPKTQSNPNILITNNNQALVQENKAILTPDMAIKLISEKGLTGLNPETKEALYLEQGIGDLPEVRATHQALKDKEDLKAMKDHSEHLSRRALEYNVIPEER
jgi:plasmid maintenance system antidote protein VapI